jgi:hypothetical protein
VAKKEKRTLHSLSREAPGKLGTFVGAGVGRRNVFPLQFCRVIMKQEMEYERKI